MLYISNLSQHVPGGDHADYTNKNIHRGNKIVDEFGNIAWQDVSVSFGRIPVDGYPVLGDTMSVEIGTDRKAVSAFTNWRDWTKSATENTKSIPFSPDGFERFKQIGIRPQNMPADYWADAQNLTVVGDSVKIAWYSPPAGEIDAAYLQPVYVVHGHVIADGRTDAFIPVNVPATVENKVALPGLLADVISADSSVYSSGSGNADASAPRAPQPDSHVLPESLASSDNYGGSGITEDAGTDSPYLLVYGAAPLKYYDPHDATINFATGTCNDQHREDLCAGLPSIGGFMFTLVNSAKPSDSDGATYVWQEVSPQISLPMQLRING